MIPLVKSDFSIRAAVPADAAAIAAIYRHHVLGGVATFETVPPDVVEMEERLDRVLSAGWPWLVAQDGADDGSGELAGYAYAGQFNARQAYRHTCEDSVYLHPERLRQGIGTALLEALIAAAEASGFRQMIALIVGSEAASIALHKRFGFEKAGHWRSVGRKHGQWLDVLSMQRALGPGDAAPPEREP